MKIAKGLALLIFGISISSAALAGSNKRTLVTLSLKDYKSQMKEIRQQGFDVAGINFPKKQVDLIVDSTELASLNKQGFNILLSRKQDSTLALDPRYQNPQKVEQTLRGLSTQYPDFTEMMSIGKSLLGRDIWAMKITNKKTSSNVKKPVLLINAMHHAREVMTPEVPLDMAQYLLSNYGKIEKVTHWVDANEIWIVPMLNVDGNNIVWTRDTWWRKNARDNYGVDINRNYPYAWASCDGSSDYRGAQDYHGPSAASEPETQTMVNFVTRIKPVFDISFHSYSELVIYPYGCEGSHTPTREVVEGIGIQMANLLPSDSGNGNYTYGTPPEVLYSVDGGDIDWMYHDAQVIPYVIEVNASAQGFQPNYDQWRDRTVNKLRASWSFLLDRLDGSGLRGILVDEQSRAPVSAATVRVERQGMQPFTQLYNVNPDGTFHLVLTPGVYNVTYSATGYSSQTSAVTIGETRTDVEVKVSK